MGGATRRGREGEKAALLKRGERIPVHNMPDVVPVEGAMRHDRCDGHGLYCCNCDGRANPVEPEIQRKAQT